MQNRAIKPHLRQSLYFESGGSAGYLRSARLTNQFISKSVTPMSSIGIKGITSGRTQYSNAGTANSSFSHNGISGARNKRGNLVNTSPHRLNDNNLLHFIDMTSYPLLTRKHKTLHQQMLH